MPLKEISFRFVGFEPVAMQQEPVDFIGEDELLEFDALLSEGSSERHGLGEGDVAIVIALDEQDRRAPSGD